ncbi:MAG: class III extradiol dioxygenase subunit B-like domain-containing protein [Candidatus Nealsonbacteria bacterium]|nr:class III extradiol dioxygenase subunit B-like domain-containing protein [Candidatus Nealsonbacteria bacterium]
MPINFACIVPHSPLLLPSVGSKEDREKFKNTINALEKLRNTLTKLKPELIIISSPHKNWGFDVPLYFLVGEKNKTPAIEVGFSSEQKNYIKTYLTEEKSPQFYFEEGEKMYKTQIKDSKPNIALIASSDLSHCLKKDGPYGFHPDGPKFDEALIKYLKKKDLKNIFKLNEKYPESGECGLRPICFLLGILNACGVDNSISVTRKTDILSYEFPFGIGYLVASMKIYRSFRVYT